MQRGTSRGHTAVVGMGPSPLVAATANTATTDREEEHPYRRSSGTLRGLLKMLRGQIPSSTAAAAEPSIVDDDDAAAVVSVYRYHGPTLRESHKALLKKTKRKSNSRRRRAVVASSGDDESGVDAVVVVPLLRHFTAFATAVERHKFVAFFVVQGIRNAGGVLCYSAHELKLRSILATDYHDAMMTFVLDVGSGGGGGGGYGPGGTTIPLGSDGDGAFDDDDEERGRGRDDDDDDDRHNLHPFCRGTGFGLFPTTPFSVPTVLSLLNVTKIPAVVVMDASSGRIVARDAVLAIERNDGHGVINRWQSGKPGLSPWQQVGAVATCDCSHGPCCDGSGGGNGNGGCCAIQ